MAASTEQKVDFLLKKIGYTASKTGSVSGTGAVSGTSKQPFGEAIPSPLVVPSTSVWADSSLIPSTPPTTGTFPVGVHTTGSAYRLTHDATASGSSLYRSFVARSTHGNQTASIDGNWIDSQFGADYAVRVFVGVATDSSDEVPQAGTSSDAWFFDYSSGVLNFNDTNLPAGIGTNNVYIVGYRYTGGIGVQPVTGVGTFSSLYVTGISTFQGLVDINGGGQANTFKVEDLTAGRVVLAGTGGEIEDSGNLTFNGATLNTAQLTVSGVTTTSGLVDINAGGQANTFKVEDLTQYRVVLAGAGGEIQDDSKLTFDANSNLNVTGGLVVSGITTLGSVGISTGLISGPATMYIDPATVGDNTGLLVVKGNLQVDGTQTTVNSSTMTVTDKNIEIAKGAANDAAADGAGITIDSGDGDKTLNWVDATDAWTSSEHIQVAAGKRLGFADDPDTYIYRKRANTIGFVLGGNERFIVNAGGATSISAGNPTLDLQSSSSGFGDVAKIRAYHGGGAMRELGSIVFDPVNAASSDIIFNTRDSNTVSEIVRFKKDGKVGIGTVNPQSELHVYKGDDSVYTKIESASGASTLELRHTNKYGSLNYYYQGTHKWLFGQINQDSDISLYQPTGVGAGEEPYRIVVKGNGNIGIHSTTPTTTLDVRGTVQVSGISTFSDDVTIVDGKKILLGDSDDLQIWHDNAGGHSRIDDTGTGNLVLRGASGILLEKYGGGYMANFTNDGSVDLYYAASKKFETLQRGVGIGGSIHIDNDAYVTGITTSARLNVTGITTVATLNVGVSGQTLVGINTILDEDNMASNSATALVTQQSVKAYVDTQVTAQDLDFQADSGGALSVDLDSETLHVLGTANEIETSGSSSGIGNTITIGLPDNVTIGNDLTVNNDLTVTGNAGIGSLSVTGVSTFVGVATFTSNDVYIDNKLFVGGIEISPGAAITTPNLDINDYIRHNGDLTTKFGFPTDGKVVTNISGNERLRVTADGTYTTGIATASGVINSETDVQINGTSVLTSALNEAVAMAIALG